MSFLTRPTYQPSPIPLQGVIGEWIAANTRNGVSLAGGHVVLTQQYLVFSPWNLDQTRAWLVRGLGWAGVPYVGEVNKLITRSKLLEPVAISLAAIAGVQPLNGAQWFKPPTVRILLQDGNFFDLGILVSPTSMNKNPQNNVAMQHFLSHLQAVYASYGG